MGVQLVIGVGAIGTATAQLLAVRGERVRLVTRSGGGPEHSVIGRVAADATDAGALSRLADGVAVIYSCAGPACPGGSPTGRRRSPPRCCGQRRPVVHC
jgi:nucleoside-diphosphate-sugar epimerase